MRIGKKKRQILVFLHLNLRQQNCLLKPLGIYTLLSNYVDLSKIPLWTLKREILFKKSCLSKGNWGKANALDQVWIDKTNQIDADKAEAVRLDNLRKKRNAKITANNKFYAIVKKEHNI